MKSSGHIKSILLLALLLGSCAIGLANNYKPGVYHSHSFLTPTPLVTDTIPAPVKATDAKDEKPVEAVIKEVPKARKQQPPIPVTVQIKPIKVIKPKIVKPVIKIL